METNGIIAEDWKKSADVLHGRGKRQSEREDLEGEGAAQVPAWPPSTGQAAAEHVQR